MAHSRYAPSAMSRWIPCPGSLQYTGDSGGDAAAHGTAAHHVAAEALLSGNDAKEYADRHVVVSPSGCVFVPGVPPQLDEGSYCFPVDDEMVVNVQDYLDKVRAAAKGTEILVERKVAFGHLIGLTADETGTLDAGIPCVEAEDGVFELQVRDLKYGTGVKVFAERNYQLMAYAAALYDEIGFMLGVARLRLCIHQPRLNHYDEWTCTPRDMQDFLLLAGKAVEQSKLPDPPRAAGEVQCKFCPGKGECEEFRRSSLEIVYSGAPATPEDFDDRPVPTAEFIRPATDEWLAVAMGKVDQIEQWCRAVRAEVEARLVHGKPIRGWKLVQGRKGPRKWTDETEATKMLKSMRLKHEQMFDYKLISPTEAERLAKAAALGERQWKKLQALITRTDGQPSVAPESDERPALQRTPTENDFDDETATADATPTTTTEESLADLI